MKVGTCFVILHLRKYRTGEVHLKVTREVEYANNGVGKFDFLVGELGAVFVGGRVSGFTLGILTVTLEEFGEFGVNQCNLLTNVCPSLRPEAMVESVLVTLTGEVLEDLDRGHFRVMIMVPQIIETMTSAIIPISAMVFSFISQSGQWLVSRRIAMLA